jgi:hypothetical protein
MSRPWIPFIYLIVSTFSASAELCAQAALGNTTKPAEITTKRLTVNGQTVSGVVVRIDGRFYVSLEDISTALNGAVTLKGDDVIVSFGAWTATPGAAAQLNGSIRGTLTYFSNSNHGRLPDTGAEIVLLSGRLEIPSSTSVITAGPELTAIGGKKVDALKATTADGSGNYSLQDVPPGEYTVLLKSSHARGASQRDYGGKIRTEIITVGSAKAVEVSDDFGSTEF